MVHPLHFDVTSNEANQSRAAIVKTVIVHDAHRAWWTVGHSRHSPIGHYLPWEACWAPEGLGWWRKWVLVSTVMCAPPVHQEPVSTHSVISCQWTVTEVVVGPNTVAFNFPVTPPRWSVGNTENAIKETNGTSYDKACSCSCKQKWF